MSKTNLSWPKELLELRVNLDKYKIILKFMKLGLNTIEKIGLAADGPKSSIEDSVLYMARVSAILEVELSSHLKEFNPHVKLRVRNIESEDIKYYTVKYNEYVKIIEERLFEFPDIYMWPYNFDTPEEYHAYQKNYLETENLIDLKRLKKLGYVKHS